MQHARDERGSETFSVVGFLSEPAGYLQTQISAINQHLRMLSTNDVTKEGRDSGFRLLLCANDAAS